MENIKQLYEDKEKTIESFPRVFMPIGSLYWNENDISSDISKYFIGTWEKYAKGKFIVNIDENDTDFANNTKTGGAKTVTLTNGQMPKHNHRFYSARWQNLNWQVGGGGWGYTADSEATPQMLKDEGNNEPHNNLPPFQDAYCWKRIS